MRRIALAGARRHALHMRKAPAHARRVVVVPNHPLGSGPAWNASASGGNARRRRRRRAVCAHRRRADDGRPDWASRPGHIRLADGSTHRHRRHERGAARGRPDMYRPVPGAAPEVYDVEGRENQVGPKAVATPGSLLAWTLALRRYGTMSLADVMQPAIRHATRGFTVTPYLSDCIESSAAELLTDSCRLPAAARWHAAEGRHAPGAGRLWGGARSDRQQGEARCMAARSATCWVECMEKAGGFVSKRTSPTIVSSSARRSAAAIAIGRSSARHRLRHRACTSPMLNILEGYIQAPWLRYRGHAAPLAEVLTMPSPTAPRRAAIRPSSTAGRAHHLQGLCRPAPCRHRPRPRQAVDIGPARQGRRGHHASDGGRRQGQRRRDHADHQQPVRRALHRSGHRHGAERLHVELRSAAGQRAVDRAGQAGYHLDVADDGAARRQGGLCAGPARRPQDFPSAGRL